MRKLEEVVFWRDYVSNCKDTGSEPAKALRGQYGRHSLQITRAETLSVDDWKPLLTTLSKDSSLHYVSICASSTRYKVLEGLIFERDVRSTRRHPALYSKYVMGSLSSALYHTVASSKNLTSLLISKIPIKGQHFTKLCQGIGKTRSLQHLAFHHCPVEDAGCSTLCKVLSSRPSLTTLDLTDCALTHSAITDIALLIKKQCCVRVSEVWKGSLRYGCPDGDDMPGLRRLTLNLNPAIGDKGVKTLTAALQDDIWIKGVDMQACGVTEEGADTVICLLEHNQCLTVFDLRGNPEATPALPSLMSKLRANMTYSKPGPFKCRWMEEVPLPSARVSKMTLVNSAPTSVVSMPRSASSHRSNLSEPPWINVPKRPLSTLHKKPVCKLQVVRSQSLDQGVDNLRITTLQKKDSTETVTLHSEELNKANPLVADNETRKPLIGVSQFQYEVLNDFKRVTQSFIKSNDTNPEAFISNDMPPEGVGYSKIMNFGGGDYQVFQPHGTSNENKPYELAKNKNLEAGDAPDASEDVFKEKTHQLLRKLIKLRSDRGLERNEGVMRVCSHLSLPQVNHEQNKEQLPTSASFSTLPQKTIN